jgi:hypothetical protein
MSLWPTPRTYAETDAGDRYGKRLHLPKSELASFEVPNRGFEVKDWPLRNRLAVWTTFLLTVMLIIFGVGSGWFIYQEQLEGFREMRGHPTSAIIIRVSLSPRSPRRCDPPMVRFGPMTGNGTENRRESQKD